MHRRLGQDGNGGGGCPPGNLPQEHPPRAGPLGQLGQRLALDGLAGHVDVDTFHREAEQLRILDFEGDAPDDLHQHLASARDRHHVVLVQDGVGGGLLDRPLVADA